MTARLVQPEMLDELPAHHPGAIGSRGDLARVNAIMGHDRILAGLWPGTVGAGGRAVDLGAGDGTLCLRLMRRLPEGMRPRRVTLVDRLSLVSPGTLEDFARLGVRAETRTADVLEWLRAGERYDVGLANLFLHHFDGAALRELLARAAGCGRALLAVEPRRCVSGGIASRLIGIIGCNAVTRHDAVVSVRAGFAGQELSAVWPAHDGWDLLERRAGLFCHGFRAMRR